VYFQNDILQADDEGAISNETADLSKIEVRLCRNCMPMAYKIVVLYLCVCVCTRVCAPAWRYC